MRVLILHMRYRPDATGTGPIVTELAEDLAACGEQVVVVTSVPHYGRSEIPGKYRGRLLHTSLESGVKVLRILSPVAHIGSVLGRGIDYATYTILAGLVGITLGPIDVVLCVAPPITVGISGWLVGSIRGCPVVFNAQDIWPDGLIQMGRVRSRLLIAFFRWAERFIYGRSARITVVSQGMRENLLTKGVDPDSVEVIPNWVDTERLRPIKPSGLFRKQHELDGKFVVLFAGNIGFAAGLETVLEAAELVRDDPRIVIMLVGEGSAKQALVQMAEETALSNVVFLTTQPAENFPEMLASCDIGLVSLKEGMGRLSVPSKTLAFMAGGLPILACVPQDSDVHRMVTEAECGVAIPPENPRALARAIRSLADQAASLEAYGRNARAFVTESFSRSDMTGRYHALLRKMQEKARSETGS
jgi:colanic acid biosynthesis glycosyl transferase WcaI